MWLLKTPLHFVDLLKSHPISQELLEARKCYRKSNRRSARLLNRKISILIRQLFSVIPISSELIPELPVQFFLWGVAQVFLFLRQFCSDSL